MKEWKWITTLYHCVYCSPNIIMLHFKSVVTVFLYRLVSSTFLSILRNPFSQKILFLTCFFLERRILCALEMKATCRETVFAHKIGKPVKRIIFTVVPIFCLAKLRESVLTIGSNPSSTSLGCKKDGDSQPPRFSIDELAFLQHLLPYHKYFCKISS